jgi:hypothetical protein
VGNADADPLPRGGRLKRTRKEQAVVRSGTEDGREERDKQSKWGNLSAQGQLVGEDLSGREGPRVWDEVIVSIDRAGQQNPPASPGPPDGSVRSEGESATWTQVLLRLDALFGDLDLNRV